MRVLIITGYLASLFGFLGLRTVKSSLPRVSGKELINNHFRITWQMNSQIDRDVPQQKAAS